MSRPLPFDASQADVRLSLPASDELQGIALSISSEGAYSALLRDTYRAEAPGLVRYFKRRMRDDEDANDLMQEAFTRLAAHMRNSLLVHPASYLQRIARNLLVDRIRSARRIETTNASALDEMPDIGTPAEQDLVIQRQDAMRLYQAAVDALPEQTRQVFIMHRVEELTYREIGERLGIAVPTVQYHLGRALSRIAQALDD
ncbi:MULTISPECIES: sigma-70 family RNA polymerase sigma factor [Sphingobium]|uniref:sigma-70 family RNA polymerase sigma factor n=1 Tax=Sphingobium TaxID=165695 RepID=UPI0022865879|nr:MULTISPECIES: sigma-70 family RNA polymerase sigma factor [Sphingobium]